MSLRAIIQNALCIFSVGLGVGLIMEFSNHDSRFFVPILLIALGFTFLGEAD